MEREDFDVFEGKGKRDSILHEDGVVGYVSREAKDWSGSNSNSSCHSLMSPFHSG